MVGLLKPPKEIATKIVREVGFEERLVGVTMLPMAGTQVSSIYSFQEAVEFLHMDSLQDLLAVGSRSHIGYLDLDQLKTWVSEVFGDKELAERIDKEIQNSGSYAERVKVIKELMQERLSQCKDMCNGVRSVG